MLRKEVFQVLLVINLGLVISQKDDILSYTTQESPFRMNKVNLLWEKARLKLAEEKLQKLYSELKVQDKEELTLKRLKVKN